MPRKKTTEEFIADARKVHGDKYDYYMVSYDNSKIKVAIMCPIHGTFYMSPNNHLKGQGCPKCGDLSMANARRNSIDSFIEKARQSHGDKYDYSQVEYIDNRTKVTIVCPKHGPFSQTPSDHVHGAGCPKCAREFLSSYYRTSLEDLKRVANAKHNFKYDYSQVSFSSLRDKVEIVCPIHGSFFQNAKSHMNGTGCPYCYGNARATKEGFIKKARAIHGDKYDYSQVDYVNSSTRVQIICPSHGVFIQKPQDHLAGYCCPVCGGSQKLTTEEFIRRAQEVHGNKYDYSQVKYVNGHSKVIIVCPEHGPFFQTPYLHVLGSGCSKCVGKYKPSTAEFIEMAKRIHGDKYDYSKVQYKSSEEKVTIICPVHGEFQQTPRDHVYLKRGCVYCNQPLRGLTKDRFIELARSVHGDKYDYSKVEVTDAQSPVTIICPSHGEFQQSARVHIWHKSGCPFCFSSHLEEELRQFFTSVGVAFEEQKEFIWLSHKRHMKLDFYFPEYNAAIECQGYQHFKAVSIFGGDDGYAITQKRDNLKRDLCQLNGIRLFYYSNLGIEYPYLVFEDKDELLNAIIRGSIK